MNGHHRARSWPVAVMQVGMRQSRLPVVRMHDVRGECRNRSLADIRGDPSERGETDGIVGPVDAVRRRIGVSRTVKQMRRVEHEQVDARAGVAQYPSRSAMEV